jgi:hypothetical protein
VKTLLEAKAQIEARNKNKLEALTCAASLGGYIDVVRNFWIAEVDAKNRFGELLWLWGLGMDISGFQICSTTLGMGDPTGLGIPRRTRRLFALGPHAIRLSGGLAEDFAQEARDPTINGA